LLDAALGLRASVCPVGGLLSTPSIQTTTTASIYSIAPQSQTKPDSSASLAMSADSSNY